MNETVNTQELLQSLTQFVNEFKKGDDNKNKKIIEELSPAIKEASEKRISKKQIYSHLSSKGLKMSFATFSYLLNKLNLYPTRKNKSIKKQKDPQVIVNN